MPQIQFLHRVLDVPVVSQRVVRTVSNCAQDREDSTDAVLQLIVDAPVVVQQQVPGLVQTVQKSVWRCPCCSFRPVSELPCCGAEANPYGPVFWRLQRFTPVAFHRHGGRRSCSHAVASKHVGLMGLWLQEDLVDGKLELEKVDIATMTCVPKRCLETESASSLLGCTCAAVKGPWVTIPASGI